MQNVPSPLGLYVPEQTIKCADTPYTNPREAEKWVADLPIAHVGETARMVYKALAEQNRTELSISQRLKLLEMFREPVVYVSEALGKHFLGQSFPLSRKNQRIAELARELQWEMALGYKIIVEQYLGGFSLRVDNKQLSLAIYRAISYLSETLLKAYQVYAPAPPQVWREIHQLYSFAEHNNLHNNIIKQDKQHAKSSIYEAYKCTLLQAVANPYRLPQLEIGRVAKALPQWSEYANLLPLDDPKNPPGIFAVDLDSDQPPSYFVNREVSSQSNIRILDTSGLTRIVRDQSVESRDQEMQSGEDLVFYPDNELQHDTLRRLIIAWGAVPKRNFSRIGKDNEVQITLGLAATHYFLTKEPPVQVPKHTQTRLDEAEPVGLEEEVTVEDSFGFEAKANFPSVPAAADSEVHTLDVWDMADNPALQINTDFDFPAFALAPEPGQEAPRKIRESDLYNDYTCKLVNESVGGCCIEWKNGIATKAVVGSLIGIKNGESSHKDRWSIGVIRWMKHIDDEGLQLGIEILAPKARAIATRNVSRKTRLGNYMRSLLLPEISTVNQPQTLLTTSLYRVGDKLEVNTGAHQFKIRLTKLLENTSTFNQFQFTVLKQSTQEKVAKGKLDRVKNFDAIWSSI